MSFESLVRSLHHNLGYSHRALSKRCGVSIRQIQKALNPEKRRQQDRAWEARRRT